MLKKNKSDAKIVNNLIWIKPLRDIVNKIGSSLMALNYYLKNRDDYPLSSHQQTATTTIQIANLNSKHQILQCSKQQQQQLQNLLQTTNHHHHHHLHQPYSTIGHHHHQQHQQQQQQQHLTSSGDSSSASSSNASTSCSNSSTGIGSFSGTKIGPIRLNSHSTVSKKPKTEPILTQFHKSERLNFANSHLIWSEEHWKRVVFQDERKFNLDGPDGFSYYYHDLRNHERTLSQRPRGGSVYIWFMITSGGPIICECATTRLKPESYLEILLRERSKIIEKLGGNSDFVLQDHNWYVNSVPITQNWLSSEGIKVQKWPNVAHDLNITENIWGWLIREVFDGGRQYSRKDDLIIAIRNAWSKIPIDLIQNLYSTMPERITELFYTRGIYTNC